MNVLVTGGAGYIGSVVTEDLIACGHHVVVFDNLSKGHTDAVVESALFVRGDLQDGEAVEVTLRAHGIDAVVHMAADSLVGESVTNPAKYYRNNVVGGLSLLNAMRVAGVGCLVFSSTAAVYGEPERQPIEEDAPVRPTNPYGETKLAFEHALRWYGEAYGLRAVSLRYFNAAGASERNGERHDPETHLVPLVLQAASRARPDVTVFGTDYPTPDGTCIRDYIHVLDLARAHVMTLEALEASTEPLRVFNLGCGGGFSVREVIATAETVTGTKIPLREGPRRAGDPAVLVASSARLTRELGWQPARQNLATIIESAWRWMVGRAP